MTEVTSFVHHLEEYEVPSFPGIMLMNAFLDITIERVNGDLDYYISAVQLEKADGKSVEIFKKGSFIYDAIVPHLHTDTKFRDLVMAEAHEHM
jgi:hypothetical protein